jgi:hypothetical protein
MILSLSESFYTLTSSLFNEGIQDRVGNVFVVDCESHGGMLIVERLLGGIHSHSHSHSHSAASTASAASNQSGQFNSSIIRNCGNTLFDLGSGEYDGCWGCKVLDTTSERVEQFSLSTYATFLYTRTHAFLYPRLLSVALTSSFTSYNLLRWKLGLDSLHSHYNDYYNDIPVIVNGGTGSGGSYTHGIWSGTVYDVDDTYGYFGKQRHGGQQRDDIDDTGDTGDDARKKKVIHVNFMSTILFDEYNVKKIIQSLSSIRHYYFDDDDDDDDDELSVIWSIDDSDKSDASSGDAIYDTIRSPSFIKFVKSPSLSHTNAIYNENDVILTVSPCTSQLSHQSLVFGVPLICIPFYTEQFTIANIIDHNDAGLVVGTNGRKSSLRVMNATSREHYERGKGDSGSSHYEYSRGDVGSFNKEALTSAIGLIVNDRVSKTNNYKYNARLMGVRILSAGGGIRAADYIEKIAFDAASNNRPKKRVRRHVANGFDSLGVIFATLGLLVGVSGIVYRLVIDYANVGENGGSTLVRVGREWLKVNGGSSS